MNTTPTTHTEAANLAIQAEELANELSLSIPSEEMMEAYFATKILERDYRNDLLADAYLEAQEIADRLLYREGLL